MHRLALLAGVFAAAVALSRAGLAQTGAAPVAPPGAASGGPVAPADADALIALAGEKEPLSTRPLYVRFVTTGHSGQVTSLAFSPDGSRLVSGGLDKDVHVWIRDAGGTFHHERLVRWDVAGTNLGVIHSVACSRRNVAIGGLSAMGTRGGIAMADLATGRQVALAHQFHRDMLRSLALSADGSALVSLDNRGRVVASKWKAGGSPEALTLVDAWRADEAPLAARLPFMHVAVSGNDLALVPRLVPGTEIWRVARYNVVTGEPYDDVPYNHRLGISALAASADGRLAASSDGTGRIYIWDARNPGPAPLATLPRVMNGERIAHVNRLAIAANGSRLAWASFSGENAGFVDLTRTPGLPMRVGAVVSFAPATSIRALAMTADGSQLAYSPAGRNDIHVVSLGNPLTSQVLAGAGQVAAVRPVGQDGYTASLLLTQPSGNDKLVFDPLKLTLEPQEAAIRPAGVANTFTLPPGVDATKVGRPTCGCALPAVAGRATLSAIGTEFGQLLVVSGQGGAARVVRLFGGHAGAVREIGSTADGRYLMSAGMDGTLRYWSLEKAESSNHCWARWGADLRKRADGTLVVHELDDNGPLFGRLIESGDVIEKIAWMENGQRREESRANEMYALLWSGLPFYKTVGFQTRRGGEARPLVQTIESWQHLLAVYVRSDQDWIAWHPAGYFDGTPDSGHLLGWQQNSYQVGPPPEFFEAERFRKTFRRPDVMQHLLKEGTLRKALAVAAALGGLPPDAPHDPEGAPAAATTPAVVPPKQVAEIRPPLAEILEVIELAGNRQKFAKPFDPVLRLSTGHVKVVAVARTEDGRPLTNVWLGLHGAPELISKGVVAQQGELRHEEPLELQPGRYNLFFLAHTTSAQGKSAEIVLEFEPAKARHELHVLAIGISKYDDAAFDPLNFAADDALGICDVLSRQQHGGKPFAKINSRLLQNEEASRDSILKALGEIPGTMADGDTAVIFFSGHGVTMKEKLVLVPHNGQERNLSGTGVDADMLTSALRKISRRGRVILILDACHSGAIEKSLREFSHKGRSDELELVVLSASQGTQRSFEDPDLRSGAFSYFVRKGLTDADSAELKGVTSYGDGVVDHVELIAFIRAAWRDYSKRMPYTQRPLMLGSDWEPPIELRSVMAEMK
jgi:WD40 repeat protein